MTLPYENAKAAGIAGVVVITIFFIGVLGGYLPQRSIIATLKAQISELEQEKAVLAESLNTAELRGAAGLMSYRANQNDFAAAAELSTGFFNGVREMIGDTDDPAVKHNLERMLRQRDEITAALAGADPEVKEKLAGIYADFFQVRKL